MGTKGVFGGWRTPGVTGVIGGATGRGASALHTRSADKKSTRHPGPGVIGLRHEGHAGSHHTEAANRGKGGGLAHTRQGRQGRSPSTVAPSAWPNATQDAQNIIREWDADSRIGVTSKLAWVPKMVKVLRDPVCKKISFTVGNLKVTPQLLEAAAQAFEGLRVPIISDPKNLIDKKGGEASYFWPLRVVYVHNQNVDDQIVKGAFLHEAAHMIHHQRGLQKVLKTESEVVSYMAQAMFYHLNDWDRTSLISLQIRSSLDTANSDAEKEWVNEGTKKILDPAWDLAELLYGNKVPGNPWPPDRKLIDNDRMAKEYRLLIEKLRGAIKMNPLYKGDVGVVLNYTAF